MISAKTRDRMTLTQFVFAASFASICAMGFLSLVMLLTLVTGSTLKLYLLVTLLTINAAAVLVISVVDYL